MGWDRMRWDGSLGTGREGRVGRNVMEKTGQDGKEGKYGIGWEGRDKTGRKGRTGGMERTRREGNYGVKYEMYSDIFTSERSMKDDRGGKDGRTSTHSQSYFNH